MYGESQKANSITGAIRESDLEDRCNIGHRLAEATEDQNRITEAPHCVTCCCLFNDTTTKCGYFKRQLTCHERCIEQGNSNSELPLNGYNAGDYRRYDSTTKPPDARQCYAVVSSGNRKRIVGPRNVIVDKLLREMKLRMPMVSDEEHEVRSDFERVEKKTEKSIGDLNSRQRRFRRRSSVGGSYRGTGQRHLKLDETSNRSVAGTEAARIRSREQWHVTDRKCDGNNGFKGQTASWIRSASPQFTKISQQQQQQLDRDNSDDDNGNVKRNLSSSEWHKSTGTLLGVRDPNDATSLHGQGDRLQRVDNVEGEQELSTSNSETDEVDTNPKEGESSELHVRELKLVRCECIKRIHEEVCKLHRLQSHLDSCSPRRIVTRTRSVSTMTSARMREDADEEITREA